MQYDNQSAPSLTARRGFQAFLEHEKRSEQIMTIDYTSQGSKRHENSIEDTEYHRLQEEEIRQPLGPLSQSTRFLISLGC